MERATYPNSVEAMCDHLRSKLPALPPENELTLKAELAIEINRLKKENKAVILGHNYMEPALYHSVPDYAGDSLELSRVAATTDADIIVFCGVRFMAETAKILSPDRTVLLPSAEGGCSLAAAITAEDVRQLKACCPDSPVVTYVNTYADVKAESDICCTSSNGKAVVESLLREGHQRIIFLPDQYLGGNVARECQIRFVLAQRNTSGHVRVDAPADAQPTLVGWPGRCEVHEQFSLGDIQQARRQYPDVIILAHPECPPDVVAAADFSGSTSAMIRYVRELESGRYLLLTECSMGDNIAAENPQCEMLRLCSVHCPHMKEITLEQTLGALLKNRFTIEVAPDIRQKALRAVERMIAVMGS